MGVNFPGVWNDPGDREEAWEIVQVNREGLEYKKEMRKQVLENGTKIDGPFFTSSRKSKVRNWHLIMSLPTLMTAIISRQVRLVLNLKFGSMSR